MEVFRLRLLETGSMRSWTKTLDDKRGYTRIGEILIFMWDRRRFKEHISEGTDLYRWASLPRPPVLYHNSYVWIYSPGPPPDLARYSL